MKLNKWMLIICSTILMLGINSARVQASKKTNKYIDSTTPTLFFHGWGSSYRAERYMTHYIKDKGITKNVIRAEVSPLGNVKLIGEISKKARNSIIEVNYQDNKNINYYTDAKWMKNILILLQKKYNIKKFNVVGHSMGNMSIMFYLLKYSNDKKMPQMQKQVNIAGHFNGILGIDDRLGKVSLSVDNRPSSFNKTYRDLMPLRQKYPREQIKVLNIYGDIGDGSDGRVSNVSSKSLKYLLNNRGKSYQELKIEGKQGQHSKLHDNKKVTEAIIKFLWRK